MKKQIAIVLTAALLSLPVTTGVVMADTTNETTVSTNATVEVSEADTVTNDETTASTDSMDTTSAENDNTSTETTTDEISVTDDEETTTVVDIDEETTVVDADGETVDPGTLADSPLAWLDELIEKIQVALTFNSIEKAELIAEQAVEDLAEAVEIASEADATEEDADVEEIEKALTTYSVKVERALTFLETVENPESEEAQKLQLALTKVNANNVVVLGSLLEKLPPQAAEKVALNIVRSMEKAIAKVEKMERKQAQVNPTLPEGDETTPEDDATSTDTTDSTQVEELDAQVERALKEFRVALGLKKGPQGNAYGYYKMDKVKESKDKAGEDAEEVLAEEQQTVQTIETQTQQSVEAQATLSTSKTVKDNAERNNDRNDKGGKVEKEKEGKNN